MCSDEFMLSAVPYELNIYTLPIFWIDLIWPNTLWRLLRALLYYLHLPVFKWQRLCAYWMGMDRLALDDRKMENSMLGLLTGGQSDSGRTSRYKYNSPCRSTAATEQLFTEVRTETIFQKFLPKFLHMWKKGFFSPSKTEALKNKAQKPFLTLFAFWTESCK